MIFFKYTFIILVTFIFQSWSSEFFTIGLFIDLSSGTNQFFGLTPLVYTTTGYFSSFLKGENIRLNKIYFTSIWVGIILVQFLIFALIVYQQLLIQNPYMFLLKWLFTTLYTLVFLGILQTILPLYKI